MFVLKNAEVYAPAYLGKKDILIVGQRIERISDCIDGYNDCPDCTVLDFTGKKVTPAYIDLHVHITGGGGEQGPASRVPEASLSTLIESGISTVVGLLGTDGITRSIENLLAKAKALNDEGITCYALTGSYAYPSPTLTGSIEKDIVFINEIVGVKLAIADHRSSNPTVEQLIEVATQARRAALLSGGAGFVTLHMGAGKQGLEGVFAALEQSDLPVKTFFPTHVALRNQKLLDETVAFAKMGGMVDVTAHFDDEGNSKVLEKITYYMSQGAPLENMTLSSDAYGSQPKFNDNGVCIGLSYAHPGSLHNFVKLAVNSNALSLEQALSLLTENPAKIIEKSGQKGCVAVGADADLLIVDQNLNITDMFALGKIAVKDGETMLKGRFED